MLRFLLNVLWVFFGGGLVIWLEYVLVGILLCLTIVGIPFGAQCFKIAGLGLLPFGKDIQLPPRPKLFGTIGNILWLLVAGFWIFLSHLGLALSLAVTIIGIPFALQHVKLALLALWPFGSAAKVELRQATASAPTR
jgi:uncharacterized membrane protein YccF (DUF307 family)